MNLWDRLDIGDCWEWTGACDTAGYGQIRVDGRMQQVHRVVFELLCGPLPPDSRGLHRTLEVDHHCRNRPCANPDHLQIVTRSVNQRRGVGPAAKHARKTHCPQGHQYTPENTHLIGNGRRDCRECHRRRNREYRARRKGNAQGPPA